MQHTNTIVTPEKYNSVEKANLNASIIVKRKIWAKFRGIKQRAVSAAYQASNELRNSSLYVLRGQRSGRTYTIPYTKEKYTASSSSESPAVRTGVFRLSWGTRVSFQNKGSYFETRAAIESNIKVGKYVLGDILESGTSKMSPRHYKQKVIDGAMPQIKEIYKKIRF